MTRLRFLIYGILLTAALYSYPSYSAFKCAKLKEALPILYEAKYAWLATAEIGGGAAIMIFLDQYRNFKIIGVDYDLNACELMNGSGWVFVMEKGA